jgi:hypothetical protein
MSQQDRAQGGLLWLPRKLFTVSIFPKYKFLLMPVHLEHIHPFKHSKTCNGIRSHSPIKVAQTPALSVLGVDMLPAML